MAENIISFIGLVLGLGIIVFILCVILVRYLIKINYNKRNLKKKEEKLDMVLKNAWNSLTRSNLQQTAFKKCLELSKRKMTQKKVKEIGRHFCPYCGSVVDDLSKICPYCNVKQ